MRYGKPFPRLSINKALREVVRINVFLDPEIYLLVN